MGDIKIDTNYKGLTYILTDYAKSVNGGNEVKLTSKQWQKTMEIIAEINSKRSSENAIYQGGSNLYGDINENFVITKNSITFTQDEMARILKEMGVSKKNDQTTDTLKLPEEKPIMGLSIEKNSTIDSLKNNEIYHPDSTQVSNLENTVNDTLNKMKNTPNNGLFSPAQGQLKEPSAFINYMAARFDEMEKSMSPTIVTAASDTINLAPPFEIKTPKPGGLGGKTRTISHKLHTKIMQLADELHCKYEDLITVINFESGMNPKEGAGKKNKAVGLIQFTNRAIKDLNKTYSLNLTKESITAMSAEEQIDLVGKYLKMCISRIPRLRNKKNIDAADLYTAIILPARAGKDILCKAGETNSNGKLLNYYESNRGIDVGNDGIITRADVLAKLDDFRVNVVVV